MPNGRLKEKHLMIFCSALTPVMLRSASAQEEESKYLMIFCSALTPAMLWSASTQEKESKYLVIFCSALIPVMLWSASAQEKESKYLMIFCSALIREESRYFSKSWNLECASGSEVVNQFLFKMKLSFYIQSIQINIKLQMQICFYSPFTNDYQFWNWSILLLSINAIHYFRNSWYNIFF